MGNFTGTANNDTLTGSSTQDSIYGLAGNDSLAGGAGNDYIDGGDGNDTLDGGSGNNTLVGGQGNDTYIINSKLDSISDVGGVDAAVINVDWYKGALASIENVSWSAGIQKLPYWIDDVTFASAPLLAADKLAQGTIYFGFPDSNLVRTTDDKSFITLPESHRNFIRDFFAKLGKEIGLTFVETKEASLLENHSTIIFSGADLGPTIGADGGDRVRINTQGQPFLTAVGVPEYAYVHEVGHVLGLKHPFSKPDGSGNVGEGPYLPVAENTTNVTVMSYTWTFADIIQRDYGILDRAALHYLYGVSPAARAGDTTHGLSISAPNFISDGSGTDTIDGRSLAYNLVLNMSPGYWSYVGAQSDLITANAQITIDFGTDIERAQGGSGNDLIIGNKLDNMLWGNTGDDTLEGGLGNDTLLGGLGTDVARYSGKATDYQVTNNPDGSVNIKDINPADGDNGTDLLRNIERVEFSSGEILKLATTEAAQTLAATQIVSVAAVQNGNSVNLVNGANTYATEVVLKGAATANASVLVLDSDVPIGTVTASTSGEWTLSLKEVSDISTHQWTARVVDDLGNAGATSSAWSVTVLHAVSLTPGILAWDGSLENDVVTGSSGNERLNAGRGNDSVFGAGGDDLLLGYEGNDTLDGGTGANSLDAGIGNDVLLATGSISANVFYGGLGDDTLIGGAGPDNLDGGMGSNSIVGGAGDDMISVTGYDEILKKMLVSQGNNTLVGGDGNDGITGGDGNDLLFGNDGNDGLSGGLGDDTLDGGAGNDVLNGGLGSNSIIGGSGNDTITVFVIDSTFTYRIQSTGNNILSGGEGDDAIEGGDGNDTLSGGEGKDFLNGGLGSNSIDGGDGDDQLYAYVLQGTQQVQSQGSNTMTGGNGNDDLTGGDGPDILNGGAGNDSLNGRKGIDTAVYSGPKDSYTIKNTSPGSWSVVSSSEGSDFLFDVEYLKFSDQIVALVADTTAPVLNALQQSGVANIAINGAIALEFSEPIVFGTGTILLRTLAGTTVESYSISGTNALGISGTVLNIAPAKTLAANTDYVVEITQGGLKDYSGNVAGKISFSFKTGSVANNTPVGDVTINGALIQGQILTVNNALTDADGLGSIKYQWKANDTDIAGATLPSLLLGAAQAGKAVSVAASYTDGHGVFESVTSSASALVTGVITGTKTSGADLIIGTERADSLAGGEGNDTLSGGAANDTIDGGAGIDVAAYAGAMANYTITKTSTGFTITAKTGTDGTDLLQNIERLQFADKSLAIDLDGNAGKVVKILGAVFGKALATDPAYTGIGLHYLDAGMSYDNLMQAAINVRLGTDAANNSKIVELLYTNIIGSAPPEAAAKFYVDLLNSHTQTAGSLGVMAADSSYNVANINLVGLIQTGLLYS